MCVGAWSLLGHVKDKEVNTAIIPSKVEGKEEDLQVDWDAIKWG
jgi:hypothetical protein